VVAEGENGFMGRGGGGGGRERSIGEENGWGKPL
jgi:hypothetical protein